MPISPATHFRIQAAVTDFSTLQAPKQHTILSALQALRINPKAAVPQDPKILLLLQSLYNIQKLSPDDLSNLRLPLSSAALLHCILPPGGTPYHPLPFRGEALNIAALPADLDSLYVHDLSQAQLEDICLRCPKLTTLSIKRGTLDKLDCLKKLTKLERLQLCRVPSIKAIPLLFLSRLQALFIEDCHAFRNIQSLDQFPNLQTVLLRNLSLLGRIPSLATSNKLKSFTLRFCYGVKDIPTIRSNSLSEVHIYGTAALSQPLRFASCPNLRSAVLCPCHPREEAILGVSSHNLPLLRSIDIRGFLGNPSNVRNLPVYVHKFGV